MSDMVVGNVHSALIAPHAGIYEALLDKAERENAELADRLSGLELRTAQELSKLERERDEAREESLEQSRLLGMGGEREARLATERDHYKQALEEISSSVQDWLDSIIQEPSLDFIHAIKAWADKKLKEL